jgi:DNA polymerase-3 subunit alpha
LCQPSRIEMHLHTPYSNIRLRDAISTIEDSIQTAADLGLKGIAITDHETVAAHVKAIQKVRELKIIDEKTGKSKIPQDFKLILGNEIYLVNSLEEVKDNYQSGFTKFPHFLLLAKDKDSHEILRFLSSQSWQQSFYTGAMERVPTTKEQLENAIRSNPNKLIASSACLGSESSIHILNGDYEKAKSFLKWCSDLFGKGNFFLELQPSANEEQKHVNEKLIEFSSELELDLIITSDVHYLRPEDAEIHNAFLSAKQGDREVASFYSNTYLHTNEEIYEKLNYIDESIITKALDNTLKIGGMIEDYTIETEIIIPKIKLPDFTVSHIFKKGYVQYMFIGKMAYSENEQDRYLVHLIEKGFAEHIPHSTISKKYFHTLLARIDVELEQLWEISKVLNQAMSAYYVTVAKIVDLMWGDDCGESSKEEGSLVGSGRGSAVAFLINYLMGITQVNPLVYGIEVPYWRHLSKDMPSIKALDVDVDINGNRKHFIFDRMRAFFGEDKFLQVCTFGTEGSKSAIQTACRGLSYDIDIAQFISSLIPFERGQNWSIGDCLNGNEEEARKPVKEFIREIEKYPKLKETALKIEGLVNKRSVHAGGVLIMNDSYVKTNALMKSPKGTYTTQFSLDDCQALGNIKYDILTIESLEKIQTTMDLLIDEGKMEWAGTLRKTFNKYLHPEIIEKENPKLFEMASSGKIPDLFQFSTAIGHSTIAKVKPKNLIEMTATNSLMRLQSDGAEQPIDTFIRFKNNISLWYKEMRDFGLNEDEISIMEEHLLPLNGVSDTQESVLLLAMDIRIAGFDVKASTTLRKSIAKKNKEEAIKAKDLLIEKGLALGTRRVLLEYVWHQISRMLSYAFSSPHTLAYTLIAMEQLNLNLNYNPLYWNTAVLTVNSGSQEVEEGEKQNSTDYGKTALAISKMKNYGVNVDLPLINLANFSFTPDIENNRIIFGMKGIVGVGDDVVYKIVDNRPYHSFEDFHERLYKTKFLQKSHIIKLIKAGSFNEFGSPIEIMKQFLIKEVDVKDKLDGKNLSRIISLGLLDSDELIKYKHFYNFKSHINKCVHETVVKPKDKILILDTYSQAFFYNNFTDKSIVGWHNNQPLVSEKLFKKEYDEKMERVISLYTDKDFIRKFNQNQFYELWETHASSNSIPKWEMESVSFYSNEHELQNIDYERYGVSNFSDLSETPIVTEEYEWRGRPMKNYQLFTIVGTVLDKDSNKNTVTVLTPDSVVTCKLYGGKYSHYDRQISNTLNGKKTVIEKSFFTRGNLLMLTGYRREDQFVLKAPKGQHTINLITEIRSDKSLGLQSERARV